MLLKSILCTILYTPVSHRYPRVNTQRTKEKHVAQNRNVHTPTPLDFTSHPVCPKNIKKLLWRGRGTHLQFLGPGEDRTPDFAMFCTAMRSATLSIFFPLSLPISSFDCFYLSLPFSLLNELDEYVLDPNPSH